MFLLHVFIILSLVVAFNDVKSICLAQKVACSVLNGRMTEKYKSLILGCFFVFCFDNEGITCQYRMLMVLAIFIPMIIGMTNN